MRERLFSELEARIASNSGQIGGSPAGGILNDQPNTTQPTGDKPGKVVL